MIDLENSVNNLSLKQLSQAELDICIEKLSKLLIYSATTTFGTKISRNIKEKKSKVSVSEKPWLEYTVSLSDKIIAIERVDTRENNRTFKI
jgi:hypothetical protein